MKKQIISEELKRIHKLAGIITESEDSVGVVETPVVGSLKEEVTDSQVQNNNEAILGQLKDELKSIIEDKYKSLKQQDIMEVLEQLAGDYNY